MYWLSPLTDMASLNTPPANLPPSTVLLSTTTTTNVSLPPFSSSASAAPQSSSSSSSSSSSQSVAGGRPIHALFRPSSGGIGDSGRCNGALSESESGDIAGLEGEPATKSMSPGGITAGFTMDTGVVIYEGPRRVGTGLDDVCIVCAQVLVAV